MILAILFASLMQPADADAAVGFYRSETPEVGAAIELDPDGRFMYALDYGAVSESAEGTWSFTDGAIRLTPTKGEGTSRGAPLGETPLRFEGGDMLLQRYEITVRFRRDAPLALPTRRNEKLERAK
jgi:hypothetical protein